MDPYYLEDRTGVAAPNTYAMKSGSRIMGEKVASKLGRELDVEPDLLRVGNLRNAMKRSRRQGDPNGVLTAALNIEKIAKKRT
ncbi:MAG: hypothetical protein M3317_16905, partial [Actinomycetota bacterium]|nr:hypothetical protein [Actinomycetota bacterium]